MVPQRCSGLRVALFWLTIRLILRGEEPSAQRPARFEGQAAQLRERSYGSDVFSLYHGRHLDRHPAYGGDVSEGQSSVFAADALSGIPYRRAHRFCPHQHGLARPAHHGRVENAGSGALRRAYLPPFRLQLCGHRFSGIPEADQQQGRAARGALDCASVYHDVQLAGPAGQGRLQRMGRAFRREL